VEQDIEKGIQLIEQAAGQGHASACADLARLYSQGEYLKKDIEKARYWWQQAAQNEYPNAQQAIDALK
jgi:hypothetical protein